MAIIPMKQLMQELGGEEEQAQPIQTSVQNELPPAAKIDFPATLIPEEQIGKGTKQINVADYQMQKKIDAQSSADEAYLKKANDRALARMDYEKELNSFLQVDDEIPRGSGDTMGVPNRFIEGGKTALAGLYGDSPLGAAAGMHDAASKRLRVTIARLKDTGNLSEIEQTAAEKIIPSIYDSEKVRRLKRAYLQMLSPGLHSGDRNLVSEVFRQIAKDEALKSQPSQNQQTQKSNPNSLKVGRFQVDVS